MFNQTMRFWNEVMQPMKPQGWDTPNSVIFENDSLILRTFNASPDKQKTPILILPPNAGHHGNIAELLVQRCLKVDPERQVYLVDWIPPTATSPNRFDTLDDQTRNILKCFELAGNKLHLFTLCQGAWAGAIAAALRPEALVSYTNAAGPIDYCACGGKIQDLCQTIPLSTFQKMVADNGGVQSGHNMLSGFKSMNPYDRYVGDYLDLWYAISDNDEGAIKKWHRFKEWYDQAQNLPGAWYLEAIDKLFKKNLLIKGELVVLGEKIDLGKIKCPVFLIAGGDDDMTPANQVFNMELYVSGPVQKKLLPGAGHIGVFVKSSSLNYWESDIIRKLDSLELVAK